MRTKSRSITHVGGLALGLWLGWCGSTAAQLPEKFENLQVLPKDIAQRQLIDIMKGFTAALGVRCQHCHVGTEGMPLSQFDFVSDEKPAKKSARLMLKMVREINQGFLSQLPPAEQPRVEVTCLTCHRGLPRPQTSGEVPAPEPERF